MRKHAITKPQSTHKHLWLPMFEYHTEDGKEYTKYRCRICNETIDKETIIVKSEN